MFQSATSRDTPLVAAGITGRNGGVSFLLTRASAASEESEPQPCRVGIAVIRADPSAQRFLYYIRLKVDVTKHKGKRRSGVIAVEVDGSLALSTLASETVLASNISPSESVEGNTLYAISADLLISLRNMTAGEGPIIVGCAHDDYSVTEIQEALQADNLDFTNKIEQEQGRRQVRRWGQFAVISSQEVLNDGKPLRVYIRIPMELGHQIKIWAWNKSGAVLTTGGVLTWSGKLFVRRM